MTLLSILIVVAVAEAVLIAWGVRYLFKVKTRLERIATSLPVDSVAVISSIATEAGGLRDGPAPVVPSHRGTDELQQISNAEAKKPGPFSSQNASAYSRLTTDPFFCKGLDLLKKTVRTHKLPDSEYRDLVHALVQRHAKRLGVNLKGTSADRPLPQKAESTELALALATATATLPTTAASGTTTTVLKAAQIPRRRSAKQSRTAKKAK